MGIFKGRIIYKSSNWQNTKIVDHYFGVKIGNILDWKRFPTFHNLILVVITYNDVCSHAMGGY